MRSLILLCVLGLATAEVDPFSAFAKEHGKVYQTRAEMTLRRSIFQANYDQMVAHNARYAAGEETWWKKVTPYYDWTQEEFAAAFISGIPKYNKDNFVDRLDEAFEAKLKESSAPDSWDWREHGGVSSVKNQGQCGSCADFAAMSAIESCFAIQRGEMFDDLSEQHTLDCAYNYCYEDDEGSWCAYGCNGAWPVAYLDWLATKNDGKIQTESGYPYTARKGSCRPSANGDFDGGRVTGLYNKWEWNEENMKEVVYMNPVTTTVLANYMGDYAGGVFNDPRCCEQATDSSCNEELNHEVSAVGYGHEDGLDYWLIKNSWDTWFGVDGYIKMKRGTGHCGVGALHYMAATCTAS